MIVSLANCSKSHLISKKEPRDIETWLLDQKINIEAQHPNCKYAVGIGRSRREEDARLKSRLSAEKGLEQMAEIYLHNLLKEIREEIGVEASYNYDSGESGIIRYDPTKELVSLLESEYVYFQDPNGWVVYSIVIVNNDDLVSYVVKTLTSFERGFPIEIYKTQTFKNLNKLLNE
jgi:hypothetical protein